MAKKLLICDLDGTLLDNIKGLSQKYADKLNGLLARGIDFTIATGRDFENTKLAIQNTHINNPIILTNGAIMSEYPSGEVIEFLTISHEAVTRIYEFASKFHLKTIVFASYDIKNNHPRFLKGTWWSYDEIRRLEREEFSPYLLDPVISIQFMYPKEQLDEMYSLSMQDSIISRESHILYFEDAFLPGMYWLEYNHKNARKEVMVESLQHLKGYAKENTIIFGDNFNDLGMFQLAGTVVVVENAQPEIKKYANYIIPSNLEGGVLQFIEEHLDELL